MDSPYVRQWVKDWIKNIESHAKWETKISKPAWIKRLAVGDETELFGDDNDADSTRAIV